MSYLNPLRLHFTGVFQANPPTVNNDPRHFDNANFDPSFQLQGVHGGPANGWWNPNGDGAFRLIGCRVTSAWLPDGSAADPSDRIRLCRIADSDEKVCAKMADLDCYQQGVSEIWGLQVRICDATGATLLRGEYLAAGYADMWLRALSGRAAGGAMYQSVLHGITWVDTKGSDFLDQLHRKVGDGKLSIKFNLDGYCGDHTNPEFTHGRIVGSIGPAEAGEPDRFVAGRQFMGPGKLAPDFFLPTGKINFCAAKVDQKRRKIYLDLGNALPTSSPAADVADIGALTLGWNDAGTGATTVIDSIAYTGTGWYEQTAGVVEVPANRILTSVELAAIGQNPLALILTPPGGVAAAAIAESPRGLYVRADKSIFRLNPDETEGVSLFATRYGSPYPRARIIALFETHFYRPSVSSNSTDPPLPPPAFPIDAIEYLSLIVADGDGKATLEIKAHDPHNPRGYIDGQVYGIRPVLEETVCMPGGAYPFNPGEFVSLLVYDRFLPDKPPTWFGSLQPIFQQYANLYPVMARFLDLGKFDQLVAKRRLLELAFSLPITDPNHMPVTRDLSRDKRKAILRWLGDVDAQGRMREGSQPTR